MKQSGLFNKLGSFLRMKNKAGRIVLCYHHIGETTHDPFEMYVSSEHFDQHCQVLSELFNVQPISSIINQTATKSDKPVVYLSFDDGYLDNFTNLYPIIRQYNFPITLFLCSKIFTGKNLYWWESIDDIFLKNRTLPASMQIKINGLERSWSFSQLNDQKAIHIELSSLIKELEIDQQDEVIDQLVHWAGVLPNYLSYPKMDKEQVIEMIDSGFVEIGAHTCHHPALGYLTKDDQRMEIFNNKKDLEKLFQNKIESFSYPHGHYNQNTPILVKEAGFKCAFTTEESSILANTDLFKLPRIWIKDWDKDEFNLNLNKWI